MHCGLGASWEFVTICFLPPGHSDELHRCILKLCTSGLTAGTWRYKAAQEKKYTNYAKSMGFNQPNPI